MDQKSRHIWPVSVAIAAISLALTVLIWGFGGEDLYYCSIASLILLIGAALGLINRGAPPGTARVAKEVWFYPAALLALLACLSLLTSGNTFRTLVAIAFWAVLVFVYAMVAGMTHRHRVRVLFAVLMIVTAYTLFGFAQLVGIFDASFWYNRVYASRFGNSNHFAALAGTATLIGLTLLFLLRSRPLKLIAALTLPINLAAIVFTETRAIWGLLSPMVFVLATYLVTRGRPCAKTGRRQAITTIATLAMCFAVGFWIFRAPITERIKAFAADDWSSVNHRLGMWTSTCNMIQHNPQGVGLDAFAYSYLRYKTTSDRFHAYRAHNEPLQMTSELGWLAAPALLWFIGALLWSLYRRLRDTEEMHEQQLIACAAACVLLFMLHSLVDFPLRLRANLLVWVIMLACTTGQPVQTAPNKRKRSTSVVLCLWWLLLAGWWGQMAFAQKAWGSAEPLLRAGDYDEAIPLLEQSKRWLPLIPRVQFELGRAYLARSSFDGSDAGEQDRQRGLRALQRAAHIVPYWAETHLRLARGYESVSDEELAEAHYIKAIESDPVMAVYRMHYANYLFKKERYDEAAARYRDAFEHFADDNPNVSWRTTMRAIYDRTQDARLLRQCFPSTEIYDARVEKFLKKKARQH